MDSDGRLDVRHTGGDASHGNEMSQMLSFDIAHGQSVPRSSDGRKNSSQN